MQNLNFSSLESSRKYSQFSNRNKRSIPKKNDYSQEKAIDEQKETIYHRNLANIMRLERVYPLNLNKSNVQGSPSNITNENAAIKATSTGQTLEMPTYQNNSYLDILKKLGIQKKSILNSSNVDYARSQQQHTQLSIMLKNKRMEILSQEERALRSGRSQTPINYRDLKTKYIHHYLHKDDSMSNFLQNSATLQEKNEEETYKNDKSHQTVMLKRTLDSQRQRTTYQQQQSEEPQHFEQSMILPQLNQKHEQLSTATQFLNLDKIRYHKKSQQESSISNKNSYRMLEVEDDKLSAKPSFMSFFKDTKKNYNHNSRFQIMSLQASRQNLLKSEIEVNVSPVKSRKQSNEPKEISPRISKRAFRQQVKIPRITTKKIKPEFVDMKQRTVSVKKQPRIFEDDEGLPLSYQGVTINSLQDLLNCINLNPGGKMQKVNNADDELTKDFIDEEFLHLVQKAKPKTDYYKQSLGDKLLFLERVDHIEYDILEQERKKRKILQQSQLDKARMEKVKIY